MSNSASSMLSSPSNSDDPLRSRASTCEFHDGMLYILYCQKFSLDRNFTQPTYPCITEIFSGITFWLRGKDYYMLYVIVIKAKKFHEIKNSTHESRGGGGENFWLYSMILMDKDV